MPADDDERFHEILVEHQPLGDGYPGLRAWVARVDAVHAPDARYPGRVPYFICPNCKQRSIDIDGVEGFSTRPSPAATAASASSSS